MSGAVVEALFRADGYAQRCDARVTGMRTHDTGPDDIWHVLGASTESGDESITQAPAIGMQIIAQLDYWERRYRHMRFHTALHVLCSVLDGLATGNQIYADKARLDYDSHGAVPDKAELEGKLNALTAAAHACETIWITDEEMLARPELIKSMSVKPPMGTGRVRLLKIGDIDLQPCGGTHVANTAEIGRLVVTRIENKGRQNRHVHPAWGS